MIDLIIPVYKNYEGLIRTIESINFKIFDVTVVDDGSMESYFIEYPLHLIMLEKNIGPGMARQYGIEHTHNPYIMFIDAGDIFISDEAQEEIKNTINTNSSLDFISFQYYHYGELTKETDNRLHGKVYKRSFLEKYGITFSSESSYLNEDIGFNRTCRLCTKMTYFEIPVIEQIKDPQSLTQKDNHISLYRDQTNALSLVSIHTIEICNKNNIPVQAEINEIATALYYWFIRTAAERPEFISQAWHGVKIFYNKFFNEIQFNELVVGSIRLKKCLQYKDKISFPINILRFARDIHTYKEIPIWYCGGLNG